MDFEGPSSAPVFQTPAQSQPMPYDGRKMLSVVIFLSFILPAVFLFNSSIKLSLTLYRTEI